LRQIYVNELYFFRTFLFSYKRLFTMNKFLLSLLLFTIIPLLGLAQSTQIDPILWQKLQQQSTARFFIMMREQANVQDAKNLRGKEIKGNYVYQRLTQTAKTSQADIQQFLSSQGVSFRSFWVVNGLMVEGNLALVNQLSNRKDVQLLTFNHPYQHHKPVDISMENGKTLVVEWGIEKIKADQVWALGFTGQGVVVGGQDTGYEWDHPALKDKYRGWNGTSADHNYNWHDAIHQLDVHNTDPNPCGFDSNVPCDDDEHGTHTMGTMVGLAGTNEIGVAPGAKWIGVRNMEAGYGTLTTYMEAFEWFIAPTDTNNLNPLPAKAPHVINNSWGCPTDEGCNSSNFSVIETVVHNVKAAGIVVVASAGNDGSDCHTIQDPPAMFAASFTVGASSFMDGIASFSSRGTVTVDTSNRRKPDVVAPGVFTRSSVPGGGYKNMSGTSMAGPHVAGAVALLISARPSLAGEVDSIEYYLKTTAIPITTTEACGGESSTAIPNNTFGYGRIDILAAVNMLTTTTAIGESSTSSFQILPNPAENELRIVATQLQGEVQIWLYSVDGKCVFARTCSMNESMDISALTSGVYTCKVLANGKMMTQKLIVK
jgi:serine protease AprX